MSEPVRLGRFFRLAVLALAYSITAHYSSAQAPQPVTRLQLAITLAGDTLIIGQQSRIMIYAHVTDQRGRPVRRAIVVFVILPSASGVGAEFAAGGRVATVTTADDGTASVVINNPSGGRGEYEVQVRASLGKLTTEATRVSLRNVARAKPPVAKWVAVAAAVGGGAAAAAVLATRGGNNHPQSPKTTDSTTTQIAGGQWRVR